MQDRKKSLLIALCIGDGHLRLNPKAKKRRTGQLSLLHSKEQEQYLEWKIELLHSLLGGNKPKKIERKTYNNKTCKWYQRVEASRTHRYFAVIHKWLYPNGKKTITRKLLDKLTPEGVAIWFMDDGNLRVNRAKSDRYNSKPKGKISSIQVNLATYVTKEEADVIYSFFKEVWDVEMKVTFNNRSGKYFHYMNTKEGTKFLTKLSNYIIPSMLYKILPPQERPVSLDRERIKGSKRERYSLNCLETYRS